MNKIVFLLLIFGKIDSGQQDADLTLSGHLTVQFGEQMFTPKHVIVKLVNEGNIKHNTRNGN